MAFYDGSGSTTTTPKPKAKSKAKATTPPVVPGQVWAYNPATGKYELQGTNQTSDKPPVSTHSDTPSAPVTPQGPGGGYTPPAPKPQATTAAPTSQPGGGTNPTTSPGGGTNPTTVATPTGSAAATTPKPPATTKNILVPDWRVDPLYMTQIADLTNNLQQAKTNKETAIGDYLDNYNQALRNLGWNPAAGTWAGNDQNTQYGQAAWNNQEDWAARGMGGSSDYLKSLANIDRLFGGQVTAMDTAKTQYNTAQGAQYDALSRQNALDQTNAMVEAVARIAANLGLTSDQVKNQTGKTVSVPVGS